MATTTWITPKFRCSFMHIFKAKPNQDNTRMEFSVVALIPKNADLSGLKHKWDSIAIEEWGSVPEDLRPLYSMVKGDKGFLTDGDKKYRLVKPEKQAMYEAYRDHFTASLRAAEDKPPKVIDQNKDEILNVAEFSSGDYARAVCELSTYDHLTWGPQLSVKLLVIQKLAEGPSFGGGVSPDAAMNMLDGYGDEDEESLL